MDKKLYKKMRRAQTSKIGLLNGYLSQKKLCEKKLKEANSIETLDAFWGWLDKQERLIQRKINGTEIKHKNILQKNINLYKDYKKKIEEKKNQLKNITMEGLFSRFRERLQKKPVTEDKNVLKSSVKYYMGQGNSINKIQASSTFEACASFLYQFSNGKIIWNQEKIFIDISMKSILDKKFTMYEEKNQVKQLLMMDDLKTIMDHFGINYEVKDFHMKQNENILKAAFNQCKKEILKIKNGHIEFIKSVEDGNDVTELLMKIPDSSVVIASLYFQYENGNLDDDKIDEANKWVDKIDQILNKLSSQNKNIKFSSDWDKYEGMIFMEWK